MFDPGVIEEDSQPFAADILRHQQSGWNLTGIFITADSWIFVYDNKTVNREMVLSRARDVITWFGCLLSAWSIFINLFLCLIFIVGIYRDRFTSRFLSRPPSRWLALNFTVVQLLIGAFIVPVNIATDRHGGWELGGTVCRVWLMSQLLLVAETMWSMFMMMFDRFLQTVSSLAYLRWSGWKTTAVEVIMSWAVAALVLVPGLMSHNNGDFILEEVCAVSMSPEHTLFVTLAVYAVPGTLSLIASGAMVLARVRYGTHECMPEAGAQLFGSVHEKNSERRTSHDYCHLSNRRSTSDIGGSVVSSSEQELSAAVSSGTGSDVAAMMAVNICCLVTWAPFYTTSVIIPFCEGHMCIDPTVWALMIWLGYSAAGLAPLCWFIDPWVRRQVSNLLSCSRKQSDVKVKSMSPDSSLIKKNNFPVFAATYSM